MARRKTQFIEGEYYHIFNRGCNAENIFRSEKNYLYLLGKIKESIEGFKIAIIAYCLMPNHYHFLLRQDGDRSISDWIQHIFNSYTKAFNKMYKRSGTLFEGSFKAIHIDKQDYLIHLCRYIHRNPLDAGLVTNIDLWKYSNYLEWIGKRNGKLADKEFVRNHFPRPEDYVKFVLEYTPPKKLQQELRRYFLG